MPKVWFFETQLSIKYSSLTPEPTCVNFKDCKSCLQSITKFDCKWCPSLNRCSDENFQRQNKWVDSGKKFRQQKKHLKHAISPGCRKTKVLESQLCNLHEITTAASESSTNSTTNAKEPKSQTYISHYVLIFCVFAIVIVLCCWAAYAYTHPYTRSGQFFIEYSRSLLRSV